MQIKRRTSMGRTTREPLNCPRRDWGTLPNSGPACFYTDGDFVLKVERHDYEALKDRFEPKREERDV